MLRPHMRVRKTRFRQQHRQTRHDPEYYSKSHRRRSNEVRWPLMASGTGRQDEGTQTHLQVVPVWISLLPVPSHPLGNGMKESQHVGFSGSRECQWGPSCPRSQFVDGWVLLAILCMNQCSQCSDYIARDWFQRQCSRFCNITSDHPGRVLLRRCELRRSNEHNTVLRDIGSTLLSTRAKSHMMSTLASDNHTKAGLDRSGRASIICESGTPELNS